MMVLVVIAVAVVDRVVVAEEAVTGMVVTVVDMAVDRVVAEAVQRLDTVEIVCLSMDILIGIIAMEL